MATIRDLIIVVETTGKKVPVNEVDGDVTAEELLSALEGKLNLPAGTKGQLIRRVNRKQILPNQTLESAGVQSNETLIADFVRTAGS